MFTTCLQIFKDVMLFFSCSTPNLATVIPAMNHIDKTLTTQSQNASFEPSIHTIINIAKKTLNNYYDKTDHTEVYLVMGMGIFSCTHTHTHIDPYPPGMGFSSQNEP